jgi:hypothetical protein
MAFTLPLEGCDLWDSAVVPGEVPGRPFAIAERAAAAGAGWAGVISGDCAGRPLPFSGTLAEAISFSAGAAT